MPRAIWKGAISFGLVYIPVELHSAAKSVTLDLDMLDRRDFAPIGYQRINKRTGAVVEWADIVKGYQYRKGEYVALSDEDFRIANVKAAQTIEIQTFTELAQIGPEYYEMPYYVVPAKGGEKPYALLMQSLEKTGKAGVGSFVMRGRQHIGVIRPSGRALMFVTLRFADELKPSDELELPVRGKGAAPLPREVAMAERLIEEMTERWDPRQYHDSYREDLMKRIQEKVRKKQTHVLTPKETAPRGTRQSAEVIDLMSVLRKSLEERGGAESTRQRTSAPRRSSPARRRRS